MGQVFGCPISAPSPATSEELRKFDEKHFNQLRNWGNLQHDKNQPYCVTSSLGVDSVGFVMIYRNQRDKDCVKIDPLPYPGSEYDIQWIRVDGPPKDIVYDVDLSLVNCKWRDPCDSSLGFTIGSRTFGLGRTIAIFKSPSVRHEFDGDTLTFTQIYKPGAISELICCWASPQPVNLQLFKKKITVKIQWVDHSGLPPLAPISD